MARRAGGLRGAAVGQNNTHAGTPGVADRDPRAEPDARLQDMVRCRREGFRVFPRDAACQAGVPMVCSAAG